MAAIVYGNTNLHMSGETIIGDEDSVAPLTGSVFGGGNQASTGVEHINTSRSTVNIVGGQIYGNVYGGANTAVVYGYTELNIGRSAVEMGILQDESIYIEGTIFGGGEANAEGDEDYDFSFISVTGGIDININGDGYARTDFETMGSIFGSGNASNTSGQSHIYIKNFGTPENPQKNISIQRATLVSVDNSALALEGATDRTNEYSNVNFGISRVNELKIKNNSTLYLSYGANVLQEVSSLVDINGQEVLGTATIDEETGEITNRNVDNRIYLRQSNNLNVSVSEFITPNSGGDINGMFFLGLYNNIYSPVRKFRNI